METNESHALRKVTVLVLVLGLVGCGTPKNEEEEKKEDKSWTSQDVDGGTRFTGGGVELMVPSAAIEDPSEIVVARLDAAAIADLPEAGLDGMAAAPELTGEVFAFTPHGTTFAEPLQVTIAHEGSGNLLMKLSDPSDTTWERVAATFANGEATFEVSGFSIYAIAVSEECVRATTCEEAIARSGVECGSVPDGCGGSGFYCPNACGAGDYCDESANECKASVCGTSCDGLAPWASYCDHDGLGSYCFAPAPASGYPAWSCDESSGECREEGMCMACDGKCLGPDEGCDSDRVRRFGAEGGLLEFGFDDGTLTIPAGAVADETEFRVVSNPMFGESGWTPHMPSPYSSASVICLRPYHVDFAVPMAFQSTSRYNSQPPMATQLFRLDDQDDDAWAAMEGEIVRNPEDGSYSVSFDTTSLGCFGLGLSWD